MGVVYKAEDTRLGRLVALKLLTKELSSEAQARFLRDARVTSALNHPNIATVFDIGQDQGQLFIAREYVSGKNLKEMIQDRPLDLDHILTIGIEVADALAAAGPLNYVRADPAQLPRIK